jgi:glycerol kinase
VADKNHFVGAGLKKVVLALDQGSSSSRVLAFDARARIVARAQKAVKTVFPGPARAEQDAEQLVRSLTRCLDDVLEKLGAKTEIVGIGLAAQRSTVIFWDGVTGKPLAPAYSWMDGRASAIVARHMGLQEDVHRRTGLYLTPYYSAPKIRWALENEGAVGAAAKSGRLRIGPVSSFLLWRLSGGKIFKTDPAMAQRMLLFNTESGTWDADLLKLFDIPAGALPEITETTGDWGSIKRKGREISVRAVMGDQQSAAYGQGGGAPGSGVLNYGTGAFFLLHAGTDAHRIAGILTSVAWQKMGEERSYFLEGTVHAAGTSFQWLKDRMGLLKDVRKVDAACRVSRHRVFMLQALGGIGAPRWDYTTPSAVLGLDAKSCPEDVVRAATEALAFFIADIVDAVRAAGLQVESLRASGGLSAVSYLLQFQSDLLRHPITRLKETEATALGAAAMAAEAAGEDWTPVLCAGKKDKTFFPSAADKDIAALLKGWRLFVETQRKLSAELRGLGLLGR